MYFHIFQFNNKFRSFLQKSSGYHTRIQKIIYFKCGNTECCKTFFFPLKVAHCRNVTVGTDKRTFIIQSENFDSNDTWLFYPQNVLSLMHLQTDNLESRFL